MDARYHSCGEKILVRDLATETRYYKQEVGYYAGHVTQIADCPHCDQPLRLNDLRDSREEALTDTLLKAVFGDGQSPRLPPPMLPNLVLVNWIATTREAIQILQYWEKKLRIWKDNECRERSPGEFEKDYRELVNRMGDGWADQNPADLDRLAEIVQREE